jgi:hypothetical protein
VKAAFSCLRRPLLVLVACVALGPPALATGTSLIDTFTGGVNTGGWTYGPPHVFEAAGGNPGAWLHQPLVDTFAPQLRTTSSVSDFTGDWRARDVISVGVDLITVSTQFPALRECTLMLSNGSCQVYFLGTEFVPQPGTGWKSFDFDVDSQSTTLPAGWTVLNSCGDDDATWNAVITNVTEVRYFYGDPTFFFIFDQWNVGADNARIFCDPWEDLRHGLAGTLAAPVLVGGGTLAPNSTVSLTLSGALPATTATLVLGTAVLDQPFKGGVMVPDPLLFVLGLPTGAAGTLALSAPWPPNLPAGLDLVFQYWVSDPGGPAGFSASNGVKATTP